jgi:hypothetical protein
MGICEKVFKQKRKAFDPTKQRLTEEAVKAQPTVKEQKKVEREMEALKKKNEWKSQSEAFREQIKYNRMMSKAEKEGKSLASLPPPPANTADQRVPCPHCGRKFDAQVADRHIPHCATAKAKPNRLQRKR